MSSKFHSLVAAFSECQAGAWYLDEGSVGKRPDNFGQALVRTFSAIGVGGDHVRSNQFAAFGRQRPRRPMPGGTSFASHHYRHVPP
jgi:hypothetical protein